MRRVKGKEKVVEISKNNTFRVQTPLLSTVGRPRHANCPLRVSKKLGNRSHEARKVVRTPFVAK